MNNIPTRDKKTSEKNGPTASIIACFTLLSLGLIAITWLYISASRRGTMTIIDACTFADTARHLCRGEGFSSGLIWPLALGYSSNIEHFPDLYNPPLFSLILGIFFKIFGIGDGTIHLCTTLIYLATIALTFIFAREIFGLGAAFLTGLLFSLHRTILARVLQGDDTILLVLLFTLTLYIIYKVGITNIPGSAATGALLGLCTLTFYPLGLLLVPLIAYGFLAGGKNRGRCLAALIGSFLAITFIWFLRNALLSGNPFLSLSWTMTRYGLYFPSMTAGSLKASPSLGFGHLLLGLQRYQVLTLLGTFILPFFIMAAFQRSGNRAFERTRNIVYVLFLFTWIVQAMAKGTEPRFLLPFLPFVLLTACGYIFTVINKYASGKPIRKYSLIAIFAILGLLGPGRRYGYMVPNGYSKVDVEIALSLLPGDAVIMSAQPQFMAWYNDRKTMPLTTSLKDFEEVQKILGDRLSVYLDQDFQYSDECAGPWVEILEDARKGYNPRVLGLSRGTGFKNRSDFLFYQKEATSLGRGQ